MALRCAWCNEPKDLDSGGLTMPFALFCSFGIDVADKFCYRRAGELCGERHFQQQATNGQFVSILVRLEEAGGS
jgi:hypothetical protein